MPMFMSVMNVPSISTQVGGLDVVADVLVAAHRAAVDAEVERMVLGDGGLAEQVGGDRDVEPLGELDRQVGQAEAVQLDAGEDDRLLRRAEQRERLVQRGRQRLRIGCSVAGGGSRHVGISRSDHVVRHLDVHRPLVPQARLDAADDLRRRPLLVEQHRRTRR